MPSYMWANFIKRHFGELFSQKSWSAFSFFVLHHEAFILQIVLHLFFIPCNPQSPQLYFATYRCTWSLVLFNTSCKVESTQICWGFFLLLDTPQHSSLPLLYIKKRCSTTCVGILLLVTGCLDFPLQCIQYIPIMFSFYLCYTWFLLSVQFWPWNCSGIKDFHPSSIRWWSGDIRVWDRNN